MRIHIRCHVVEYIYIDFLRSYSHVREAKVRQGSSVSEINVELNRLEIDRRNRRESRLYDERLYDESHCFMTHDYRQVSSVSKINVELTF